MAILFAITEDDIASGLRERNLRIQGLDDLTRGERELVEEYAALVFGTARREFLDALAQAIRRRRGLPE